jgi:hypothetical protein
MRLNATFIGTDSLGFKSGEIYEMLLHQVVWEVNSDLLLNIETIDGKLRCQYTNIKGLMSNWKINQFHQDTRPNGFWNKEDYSNIRETIMTNIRERKLKKLLN